MINSLFIVPAHCQLDKMLNYFFQPVDYSNRYIHSLLIGFARIATIKLPNFLAAGFYEALYFVKSKAVILYF